MALNVKNFAVAGATVLLAILIVVSIAGSMIPSVQSSARKLNESALCNAQSGCLYNATGAYATVPCRSAANTTNVCASLGTGADQAPAIFDLLDSNTAVIFTIIAIGIFATVIGLAFKIGKK